LGKRLRRLLLRTLVAKRLLFLRIIYKLWGIEPINEALLTQTIGLPDLLRTFGAHIGDATVIHGPLIIHNAKRDYSNLHIGTGVHIGRAVLLDLSQPIRIEDQAVISMRCTLLTHQDVGDRPLQEAVPMLYLPLTIATGAYLGSGVTLLAGAQIGAGAIVGAGALVTNPVTPNTTVVGVPARPIQTNQI